MTLTQFSRDLEGQLRSEAVRAVGAAIGKGEAEAKAQSNGPLTPKDKRDRDYPYATRHGSPLVPLLPINVVTGAFLSDWGTSIPTAKTDQATGRLFNFNEKAEFLKHGTEKMFARPIEDHLREYVADEAVKEINFSLRKIARRYQ